ncbi:hypothetical protein EDD15DRAFT_367839 [Pisolithus albus]|nr:hypothetical protein EDD15DRAFT_367839 [Pisolithus albus]
MSLYLLHKFAVTNIKQTDLTLSLSNSLEKKANLLDIQANLSLEILSDLVKVEGSASYLKSNSQAWSWILVLKVLTEERRLLFAEDALSINVLDMVKKDYIAENRATHFVSSIVYGGNLIINMTERATEVTNEESIEGKLGLELEKLKGAVSLKGKAEAKIKDQFEGMDSKFDLVVHGDVELDTVPDKPVDVLDLIPRAAKLLLGNPENGAPKGVPISVTLQPIPNSILNDPSAVSVHRLCQSPINDVFETFSRLEDVRSRFRVLVNGTGVQKDFIPKLAECVDFSFEIFRKIYADLLQKLAQFLRDMMATGKSDVDMFPRGSPTNPKPEEHRHSTDSGSTKSTDLPGSLPSTERHSLLDRAEHLYGFYTGDSHKNLQQGHGERGYAEVEPLSFLEPAFQDFQFFVSDIQRGAGGQPSDGRPLSTVVDISRTLYCEFIVHLFIMTPLCLAGADLAVIRILALLRKYNNRHTRILYTEDLSEVQKLPGGEFFSDLQLKKLTYYVGEVDDSGKVSWQLGEYPNPIYEMAFPDLLKEGYSGSPYNTHLIMESTTLDTSKPFSVVFMAKPTPGHPFERLVFLETDEPVLLFTADPITTTCSDGSHETAKLQSSVTVGEQPSVVAFV